MSHKVIRTSNLALRFYVRDGWTKEELDAVCTVGSVHCAHPNDEFPYFTLNYGEHSRFDCKKLLALADGVERRYDDRPGDTDLEFLESMNY